MISSIVIYIIAFATMVIQLFFLFLILTVIEDRIRKNQKNSNHTLTSEH